MIYFALPMLPNPDARFVSFWSVGVLPCCLTLFFSLVRDEGKEVIGGWPRKRNIDACLSRLWSRSVVHLYSYPPRLHVHSLPFLFGIEGNWTNYYQSTIFYLFIPISLVFISLTPPVHLPIH